MSTLPWESAEAPLAPTSVTSTLSPSASARAAARSTSKPTRSPELFWPAKGAAEAFTPTCSTPSSMIAGDETAGVVSGGV